MSETNYNNRKLSNATLRFIFTTTDAARAKRVYAVHAKRVSVVSPVTDLAEPDAQLLSDDDYDTCINNTDFITLDLESVQVINRIIIDLETVLLKGKR